MGHPLKTLLDLRSIRGWAVPRAARHPFKSLFFIYVPKGLIGLVKVFPVIFAGAEDGGIHSKKGSRMVVVPMWKGVSR